jgi:HEAT repeat protein
MIKWSDDANEDSVYTAAARLLMFAKLSQHYAEASTPPRVVAVIQSLSQGIPQSDSLLKFALGDKVDRNPIVVDVDAIASTAFVLPCVESPTDQFPVDIENATYFLVMHPSGKRLMSCPSSTLVHFPRLRASNGIFLYPKPVSASTKK